MEFEVDGFLQREREEAGVNVKVDHHSLLFIVLLISKWLPQVNRYHYRPLCRTERNIALVRLYGWIKGISHNTVVGMSVCAERKRGNQDVISGLQH